MKITGIGKAKGNEKIRLYNCDNMELMKQVPDQYYDLAIVDPPYGIDVTKMNMGNGQVAPDKTKSWDNDIPDANYFAELFRASKNQIIWGGNYFPNLWPTRCFFIWDKGGSFKGRSFAECELAWTSLDESARSITIKPIQVKHKVKDKQRFHPTAKPMELYAELLRLWALPEFKILDTHLGSGSIAAACHYFGCSLDACEIDKKYFKKAVKRFKSITAQEGLIPGLSMGME